MGEDRAADLDRLLAAERERARAEALDEVERWAARHSNLRRTMAGPAVESVTLNELATIVRAVRDRGEVSR